MIKMTNLLKEFKKTIREQGEEGKLGIKSIWDNGGKTFDRYTIVLTTGEYGGPGENESLGLSDNPDSPQGFSQMGMAKEGPHLGKQISFNELPERVQKHARERLS